MVTAADKSLTHLLNIGMSFVHLDPSRMVSQRNVNVFAKPPQVLRGAGDRVPLQVEDGVFLSLRPSTLAADIRSHRRQHPKAEIGQNEQAEHDRGKRPN